MKYKLSDVVDRINGNVDRFTTSLEYYVGGEHFESNELEITGCGLIKPNVNILGFKFHFAFQPGDVLYMARNPHLRKAGMVNFSGIRSDASYILRTKDSNVLCQEYLAVIMQSNHLWDYCESHKVGSVNFAINWKTLANYEFDLPDINIQRSIANRIWAAYRVKQAYKKLISATDEMVKSRFIEMFAGKYQTKPLSDFIESSFPGEWGTDDANNTGTKVIRTTNFTNEGRIDYTNVVTRQIDANKIKKKKLQHGDIILERSGGTNENPVGRVVLFNEDGTYIFNNFTQLLRPIEDVNNIYLFYSLFNYYHLNKHQIRSMGAKTTGIQNLNMELYMKNPIYDAPMDVQDSFATIFEQADKSKFDGFKSRFIEWFGNPFLSPKNGKSVSITDVADIVLGTTPNSKIKEYWDGELKWITPAEIEEESFIISDTVRHITEDGRNSANLTLLPVGSVLFSTRAPIGKVAIAGEEMYCNQGFKNFICKPELNNVFLYYTLRLNKEYLVSLGTGTTFKELSKKIVESIKISVPAKEQQEQFETLYRQADKSKYYKLN